jgi:hypothetical protein
MSGNTGVAGGTKGADPVPQKTAPDGSTVLDESSAKVVNTEQQPQPEGDQNTGYAQGETKGVDDDGSAVG